MYYLVVFNDLNQTEISAIIRFKTIKSIISFTNGIINYSDVDRVGRKYKTFKSLFKVIRR
tara:strand:- start:262 stop:441 length:180 start_codon:yes stop_codon:yes gene_type:complete